MARGFTGLGGYRNRIARGASQAVVDLLPLAVVLAAATDRDGEVGGGCLRVGVGVQGERPRPASTETARRDAKRISAATSPSSSWWCARQTAEVVSMPSLNVS